MCFYDRFVFLTCVATPGEWKYFPEPAHWQVAQLNCGNEGGHLISLHSERQDALVASFLADNGATPSGVWIGGHSLTNAQVEISPAQVRALVSVCGY